MNTMFSKKIFINGKIKLKTGLTIGGTDVGLEIGGIDKPIVRHPVTKEPYIPGSSLKGKIRSLLEKAKQGDSLLNSDSKIHICPPPDKDTPLEQIKPPCEICTVFGMPAETAEKFRERLKDRVFTTRLIVRDCHLTDEWKKNLPKDLPLPYAEVKTEVVIDRITSAATPRTFERVPAGAEFDLQLVLTIYQGDNEKQFVNLIYEGLRLLQDDYLGGQGSRGYGQVKIKLESVKEKTKNDYINGNQGKDYIAVPIPSDLQ